MKLIVPKAGKLLPATKKALANYAVEVIDVKGDDGYPELLRDLWADREPFTIVEHDVVPWDGALEAMWECDKSWCGYGYGDDNPALPLGCVSFTEKIMEAIPDVWIDLLAVDEDPWTTNRWQWSDTWLDRYATARGYTFHRHDPPVENRHTAEPQLTVL